MVGAEAGPQRLPRARGRRTADEQRRAGARARRLEEPGGILQKGDVPLVESRVDVPESEADDGRLLVFQEAREFGLRVDAERQVQDAGFVPRALERCEQVLEPNGYRGRLDVTVGVDEGYPQEVLPFNLDPREAGQQLEYPLFH